MKTAFISYASKDYASAHTICEMLEARGIACWMAPEDITPGKNYGEEIILGIESTAVTLLLLSQHANESPFVLREIERATSKHKPVLPVLLDNVKPSTALELFVSSAHWLEAWHTPLAPKIDLLAASIRQISGQPQIKAAIEQSDSVAPPSGKTGGGNRLAIGALIAALLAVGTFGYLKLATSPVAETPSGSPATASADASQQTPPLKEKPQSAPVAQVPVAPPATPATRSETKIPAAPTLPKQVIRAEYVPAPSRQCSNILQKASLGESLNPEEQTLLKTRCS